MGYGTVAPHAGALVETQLQKLYERDARVAPHAGALVETPLLLAQSIQGAVAPHAGALVETIDPKFGDVARMSRLTQAR